MVNSTNSKSFKIAQNFHGGAKPPSKGLIKATFTYLLHFFSFLDQTCQIDYGCGPNDCKFSFDAKCQIVTSPNGLNGIFNFKVKLISFESALEEE